jgi:signal transduction histidine kinase
LDIVSNALYALNLRFPKFSKDKSFEIKSVAFEIEGRKHVRTTFHDGGFGIPENILNIICGPFFSTKPKGEGTGLGLFISNTIINDHGGKLWFETVEGEYTKVIVDLPEMTYSKYFSQDRT